MDDRPHSPGLTGTQYWRRIFGTLFLVFVIGMVIAGAIAAAGIASDCIGDLIKLQFDLPSCMSRVAFGYVLYLIFKWGAIALLLGIVVTFAIDLVGRWREGSGKGSGGGRLPSQPRKKAPF